VRFEGVLDGALDSGFVNFFADDLVDLVDFDDFADFRDFVGFSGVGFGRID
jgi:hypothetical protein